MKKKQIVNPNNENIRIILRIVINCFISSFRKALIAERKINIPIPVNKQP